MWQHLKFLYQPSHPLKFRLFSLEFAGVKIENNLFFFFKLLQGVDICWELLRQGSLKVKITVHVHCAIKSHVNGICLYNKQDSGSEEKSFFTCLF